MCHRVMVPAAISACYNAAGPFRADVLSLYFAAAMVDAAWGSARYARKVANLRAKREKGRLAALSRKPLVRRLLAAQRERLRREAALARREAASEKATAAFLQRALGRKEAALKTALAEAEALRAKLAETRGALATQRAWVRRLQAVRD